MGGVEGGVVKKETKKKNSSPNLSFLPHSLSLSYKIRFCKKNTFRAKKGANVHSNGLDGTLITVEPPLELRYFRFGKGFWFLFLQFFCMFGGIRGGG